MSNGGSGTTTNPAYSYTCTPGPCPAETYSQDGRGPCTDCSAGKSSNKAATSCDITCQAGQFTPGGTPCETCPAGSYGPFTEAGSCISCPADTYSPKEAATSSSTCLDCPEGRTSEKGAASCEILSPPSETCPAGFYGPVTEAGSCISCPADTYSPKEAATSSSTCLDCPEGRTSEKGAASCEILSPPSSSSSSVLPIVGGGAGALALLGAAFTII